MSRKKLLSIVFLICSILVLYMLLSWYTTDTYYFAFDDFSKEQEFHCKANHKNTYKAKISIWGEISDPVDLLIYTHDGKSNDTPAFKFKLDGVIDTMIQVDCYVNVNYDGVLVPLQSSSGKVHVKIVHYNL